MPLYTFRCEPCSQEAQLFLEPTELKLPRTCRTCGFDLKRVLKGQSAQVVEVIDSGFYARAVKVIKK
jgi:putative FmdB family regulatory protein